MGGCVARAWAMNSWTEGCLLPHAAYYFCAPPGLGRGGQQLQACRKAYIQSIELLVALANLQVRAGPAIFSWAA